VSQLSRLANEARLREKVSYVLLPWCWDRQSVVLGTADGAASHSCIGALANCIIGSSVHCLIDGLASCFGIREIEGLGSLLFRAKGSSQAAALRD